MVTLIRVCERGTRCLHAREHRRVAILRQNPHVTITFAASWSSVRHPVAAAPN
jgi:hypothetical protein